MKDENQKIKLILQKKVKGNTGRKIAIWSSLKSREIQKNIDNIYNQLKDEKLENIEFVPLTEELDIKKLAACDMVVLVEKYQYTKYKDFTEMVEMLHGLEIEILGVVTI